MPSQFFLLLLFAQAADIPLRSPWDIALQFGMAGAVLVVVFMFLGYLKGRDVREQAIVERLATVTDKAVAEIERNTKAITALDMNLRSMYHTRREDDKA